MAKLKFKDLSDEVGQRYGYRPEQAAAYEAEQARVRVAVLGPPIPTAPPGGASPQRAANIALLRGLASDFHSKHTYSREDSFVCVDMACDVWDMVKTRGLDAKIMAGNVRKDISSLAEANHTWVMVEVSPGDWVAIEATGGRVVERAENSRYYRGRSFSTPKELKDFYYGRGTLARS